MAEASSSSKDLTVSAAELEVEKLLNRQATEFQRDIEVNRILKAFKLNPYDILDLNESASADDIKKKYRQLSLFIHPDKCKHEQAPEAFDILKKAEGELSDERKRGDLDAVIKEARMALLQDLSLPTSTAEDSPVLKSLNPSWNFRLRNHTKQLLIDEEVRRRRAIKMNLANEGLEARKKDEEATSKKRKVEDDKTWEDGRDHRVDTWRSFAKDSKKKKKSKIAILG